MMTTTSLRRGASSATAVLVVTILSSAPAAAFSPALSFPGVPSHVMPLRARSTGGSGLRMQAERPRSQGLARNVALSGVCLAPMAAAIAFGPMEPVEPVVAFQAPSAPAAQSEQASLHLARQSWLEGEESIDELIHHGISGKDNEEEAEPEKRVISSFLPEPEKKEPPTSEEIRRYILKMAGIWTPTLAAFAYLRAENFKVISKQVALIAVVVSTPVAILLSGMATSHADWPLIYVLLSAMVVWSPAVAIAFLTDVIDSLRAESAGKELIDRR